MAVTSVPLSFSVPFDSRPVIWIFVRLSPASTSAKPNSVDVKVYAVSSAVVHGVLDALLQGRLVLGEVDFRLALATIAAVTLGEQGLAPLQTHQLPQRRKLALLRRLGVTAIQLWMEEIERRDVQGGRNDNRSTTVS